MLGDGRPDPKLPAPCLEAQTRPGQQWQCILLFLLYEMLFYKACVMWQPMAMETLLHPPQALCELQSST